MNQVSPPPDGVSDNVTFSLPPPEPLGGGENATDRQALSGPGHSDASSSQKVTLFPPSDPSLKVSDRWSGLLHRSVRTSVFVMDKSVTLHLSTFGANCGVLGESWVRSLPEGKHKARVPASAASLPLRLEG